MKAAFLSLFTTISVFVSSMLLAASPADPNRMMADCPMMNDGMMLLGMVLLALIFVALILAILSLIKYLFSKKQ